MFFQDLPLDNRLLKAVDALGLARATEVQEKAIPLALAGRDLLVSAPTGSGKTAAFVLPVLHRLLQDDAPGSGTRALILLPTRELALQTQKTFEKLAAFTHLKCGLIIGGEAFKHQIATLRKNPEVIIATPGRLVEHISNNNQDFSGLEVLILDEADRMLDMGFAVDMTTIAEQCNKQRQNLLFSATLQHQGLGGICRGFTSPERITVGSSRTQHEDVTQQMVLADDSKHKEKLVAALIAEEAAQKVIVFCKTRLQCEQLGNTLRYLKIRAQYIHGEIAQNQRKQVLNQFRQGGTQVLVATDLAARGLDIDSVDLVINFSVAHSGDDHLHRTGRTGRAGQKGKAISLIDRTEWNQMSSIERYLNFRFERRVVEGLKADYSGPKKLKKSGKAAGPKKRKSTDRKGKTAGKKSAKVQVKAKAGAGSDRKTGLPSRAGSSAPAKSPVSDDGFGAFRRKT